MALQAAFIDDTGTFHPNAYAKLRLVRIDDVRRTLMARIDIWHDRDARLAGHRPLLTAAREHEIGPEPVLDEAGAVILPSYSDLVESVPVPDGATVVDVVDLMLASAYRWLSRDARWSGWEIA